jgi:hypothetical protein
MKLYEFSTLIYCCLFPILSSLFFLLQSQLFAPIGPEHRLTLHRQRNGEKIEGI